MGLTTALSGAGGFGKTTLASAVCAHRRVRRHFRRRIYTVTIGHDVRGRAAIAAKIAEVTRFITGDTQEFPDPDLAGQHLGRLLDQRPRTLLVLDDVWEDEQLAPFLQGGQRCLRLITTRNPALLPPGSSRIHVDQMSAEQARALLTWQLPSIPADLVDGLLRATGRWALLLRLTNRLIAQQTATGARPVDAARNALQQLRVRGPAAIDDPAVSWSLDDPRERSQAVRATIEAATLLLPPGGADRFAELAIFAEDETIPVPLVALMWQATGGLTETQTRNLCGKLERLSLITLAPDHGGRISLHDVIRDYLRADLGTATLTDRHAQFINAVATTVPPAGPLTATGPAPGHAWWERRDGYLLDHLIDHLRAAAHITQAEAVASDIRWVEARLFQRGPTAPWSDLTSIGTPNALALARSLAQAAHLLVPASSDRILAGVLYTRLQHHPHWRDQVIARQHDPAQRPLLAAPRPLPDQPSQALQRTLTGHAGMVVSVAISPDGTWLATAGSDTTVRIWDATTGTTTATLTGHTDSVMGVAISPDGTWLATAGSDTTARIWDATTGTTTATLTGHTDLVMGVAISPDGTWLATASNDRTVRIWDATTGTATATLSHPSWVESVAISPDSTWLATSCNDGRVRIWDIASGTSTATLSHPSWVRSVAISPDGTWLATSCSDGTVRIWDAASGTSTATLSHPSWVRSVAISPDSTWLATISSGGMVRIWDATTGTATATLSHNDGALGVAISPDGTWLATSCSDGTVRIWDAASGTSTAPLTGHTDLVEKVAISLDGTRLATAGHDRTVRIWDIASGASTAALGHDDPVRAMAISPDGTWLATSSDDDTVRIWDIASGASSAILTGHDGAVESVAISPDGTWLATASYKTVRIWDIASGTSTATLTGHTAPLSAVAISPDGTWLATASYDKTVRIWDIASGAITAALTGHTVLAWSMAISPDGTWLAISSGDTVRVWDVGSRSTEALARFESPSYACAWCPDNRTLIVGGGRGMYLLELLT
ncbi:NB-ARC domain-containing protein [Actinacidiphila glaucinigra]|uniref:NB-ARC domain-containing protein n=1 Tax=Actinacidiphila glaucinigra TaxID=235986 RepID=UPI0033A9011B